MKEELPDKIIELDQVRINRGLEKICKCKNRRFMIDAKNRRVTCQSCGAVIDPYDALYEIGTKDEYRMEQVQRLLEQKKQIMNYKPHLKVFKYLEKRYRRGKYKERAMLPCCPECGEPFFFEHITSWFNRQMETLRRKWEGKPYVE